MPHAKTKISNISKITLSRATFISKAVSIIAAAKNREFRVNLWEQFASQQIQKDYAVIQDCKDMLASASYTMQRCIDLDRQIEEALKLY